MAKKRFSKLSPSRVRFSPCRALVLIDARPIKMEEQRKCLKLQAQIEIAKSEIKVHETQSVPAFLSWMNERFGKDITAVRDVEQKVFELQELIELVDMQSSISGSPPGKVYEKILDLKERQRDLQNKAESFYQAPGAEGFTYRNTSDNADYEEERRQLEEDVLRNSFEMIYGTKRNWRSPFQTYEEAFTEFREGQRAFNEGGAEREKKDKGSRQNRDSTLANREESTKITDTRLRDTYRTLARRFHPDVNPHPDANALELWLKVQAAYDAGDFFALESLTTLGHLYDQNWDRIDSLGSLLRLRAEMKRTYNQLSKKMNQLRKDQSWNFFEIMHSSAALASLERQVRNELKSNQLDLRSTLRRLEMLVDSWSNRKGTKNKGHPSRPRQRMHDLTDEFAEWL